MDSLSCFLHNINSTLRIQDAYVKMDVYNIRLELQMEIEQRYMVSSLHRKGMQLPALVAELAAVYHEEAFDENRVEYWLHEMKLHCSDLNDRPSSGLPLLKISMPEFYKSWKFSHGLRFERSLSPSRFLRRRSISI
jgi:hypothetical protein